MVKRKKSYKVNFELLEVARLSKGFNAYVLWHQLEPEMSQAVQSIDLHADTLRTERTILNG